MKENFNLSQISWFGVGGKAEFFYKAPDIASLSELLKLNNGREITIIGNASNLLIRDGGVKGISLKLGKDFSQISRFSEDTLEVGAAAFDKTFAMKMLELEISGFEFLSTIPGTLGGGVKMNCGCFGNEIGEVLTGINAIDERGNKIYIKADDIKFSYRNSDIPDNIIITSAILKGVSSSRNNIMKTMRINEKKRVDAQPVNGKTCGSTFKNPETAKAWELLIQSGANLLKKGGARFSEKHANFILNDGSATAFDIEKLGEEAIVMVKEKCGVTLEWEIRKIGFY